MKKYIIIVFLLTFSLFSFGYNLQKGKVLNNNIFATNENIKIDGFVKGDITSINGNVILGGKVKGDISVINGNVILKNNSSVNGNILIIAGELKRGENTKISGSIFFFNTYKKAISMLFKHPVKYIFTYSYSLKDKSLISTLITTFAIFLLMLFIVLFFPKNIENGLLYIKNKKGKFIKYSVLYFLIFILLIFISLLLSAIYIGIIFLIIFSILFVACLIFGRAIVLIYIGNLIFRRKGKFVLKLLLGNIIYLILNFVPGIAILSHILLQMTSIGSAILTRFGKKA